MRELKHRFLALVVGEQTNKVRNDVGCVRIFVLLIWEFLTVLALTVPGLRERTFPKRVFAHTAPQVVEEITEETEYE